jgi:hypothetical protein
VRRPAAAALIALALAEAALSAAPAEPLGPPPRPRQLLGRWGDNGDCSKDVIFRGDGTFRSYNGGQGNWRIAGERLTMTGPNGSFELRVRRLGRDRLRIVNPDGSVGVSQRC